MLEKCAQEKLVAERAKGQILSGARVYLSGPMDFVASRTQEKNHGWRTRVGQFLKHLGAFVFDPWDKPQPRGLAHYAKDYEFSTDRRKEWSFADTPDGEQIRAELCQHFYPTVHLNRRMVDVSDFLVACCPTNIYSVGTVHEIVMARLQHKPVLLVSPPVVFPAMKSLQEHLKKIGDIHALKLLDELQDQVPIKANPDGIPSPWYMALIHEDYFFDGFGFKDYFDKYSKQYGWQWGALDELERTSPPQRPLLPYLEKLSQALPLRYDVAKDQYVENHDWLIFETLNASK